MEQWINRMSDEPLFAGLMIMLLGAALFFVARRVMTLAALSVVGFLAVVGYFAFTGQEPPDALKEITEKAKEVSEKVGDKAKEAKEKLGDELKEAAKAGVKEAIQDGVDNALED